MKKLFFIPNLLLLLLFTTQHLQAFEQNDSLNGIRDSLIETKIDQRKMLKERLDSIQLKDSLLKINLLNKIANAKVRDSEEKRRLEERLDSLKKESETRRSKIKEQVDALRSNNPGFPVILFDDTLFYIYSKLGPFTPGDRAKSISNKLEILVKQNIYKSDLLSILPGDESHDIVHAELIILSITERDAFWLNKSQKEIASLYVSNIKNTIAEYKKRTSIWVSIKQVLMTILVIIILFYGIKYLNRGFTHLNKTLIKKGSKYIKGIEFKNYEFLSAEQVIEVVRWVLKLIKWLLIAFIIYLALPIIFSIFPSTKGIANTLFGYVLTPLKNMILGFINYIPEIISILVIIIVTKYFVRFLKFMSNEVESGKLQLPGFYPDWATPTFNILRVVIYAFAFVIIFPYLPGSDSVAFQGVSVFLGLLISLGSTSVIGNILAGLVITYMRAFKIGDRVKIGEVTGDVIEKTMFVIRVRTIKNEEVTIPNSAVLAGNTKNYSSNANDLGLILSTTITIGYDVPWQEVHKLLIDAALKTEYIRKEPAPFVLQTSLDDFYVSYQINATTDQPSMSAKIYSQLHSNIQTVFHGAGVEILSPHYRSGRDGNKTTIPENHLPPDYISPSFNIKLNKD